MPRQISDEQKRIFLNLVGEGLPIQRAADKAGVSYTWAKNYAKGRTSRGEDTRKYEIEMEKAEILRDMVPRSKLKPEAQRALEDFAFFRERYLGNLSRPWAIDAGERIVSALESPHKEFQVVNIAPGIGKTTLLHDVAAWATVRNRGIRGVFGSRVGSVAQRSTRRLQRTLERTTPVRARDDEKVKGLALDGAATLAGDYGAFRSAIDGDLWRADQFVVLQESGRLIDEKEPTWSAISQESGFLGNRYDLIFWDDLVSNASMANLDSIEKQRVWWDDEAETRLDPGGALFLVGQRIAAADLYRYNLDKRIPPDEDVADRLLDMAEAEANALLAERPAMYEHVVYQAHDEALCKGSETHVLDAAPWPKGCLLDPRRQTWRELRGIRATKPRTFSIQYQQEDVNPEDALVAQAWVDGGVDPNDGIDYPGVYDKDRGLCEVPAGLVGRLISFCTVDPSPTKMWAVQWWVYAPDAEHQLFLLDSFRGSMAGSELLDWSHEQQRFVGLMEEWQVRAKELGWPIKEWVIEINAAQRFLLQYEHVRRWRSLHGVAIRPHQTTVRKLDEKLGLDMVKEWWRSGRIRLPRRGQDARFRSLNLVNEVTRYPNAGTDDQVMAHWFAILHLPEVAVDTTKVTVLRRPSWSGAVPHLQLAGGR